MKKFFPYLFLIFSLPLCAQNTGQLDIDNGFGKLKILADLDTIPGFVSIFQDPDVDNGKFEYAMLGSQYTYTGTEYKTFAKATISKIFLTTVSAYITEIKVVCSHDSSVIDSLNARYGQPTSACVVIKDHDDKKATWSLCIWQGKDVRLTMTSKKYYDPKDNRDAEVPDYMYIKITSLQGETFYKKF